MFQRHYSEITFRNESVPSLATQNFRTATTADVLRCHEIETNAYEGDEAATLEKIS